MAPVKKKPQSTPQPTIAPVQQPKPETTGTPEPTRQPITEMQRVKERKLFVIKKIQDRCSDPVWQERMMKIAAGDESRIMRAVNSYTTFIANDQGSGKREEKKYICDASISSLFTCFLEAFQMGLEIGGGRDHVSIIVYNTQAELEVTYKGFAYALNRHFDNSFVQCGLIFEGDEFDAEVTNTTASFTHKPKNLLNQKWEIFKGAYCYFQYTNREDKKAVSRLVVIDKPGIEMIRSKAKTKYTWDDFWGEMTLKAVIRRSSKIPFATIDFSEFEIDPAEIDNRHFLLEDKTDSSSRLSGLMKKQKEMMEEEDAIRVEPKVDNKPTEQSNSGRADLGQPGPANVSRQAPIEEAANAQETVDDNATGQVVRYRDASENAGAVIDNEPHRASLTDEDFENGDQNGS